MRTLALKLIFGISSNQTFERHSLFSIILSDIISNCVSLFPLCVCVAITHLLFICINLLDYLALICRTIAVHFTDPFHVRTRVSYKGVDDTILLQVPILIFMHDFYLIELVLVFNKLFVLLDGIKLKSSKHLGLRISHI